MPAGVRRCVCVGVVCWWRRWSVRSCLGGCETSTKARRLLQHQGSRRSADHRIGSGQRTPATSDGAQCVGAARQRSVRRSQPRQEALPQPPITGSPSAHFRRAVELRPKDAEAWVGLAASYDRLRRFELADRAYEQAVGIVGPTPEVLNNQGYSYMLRGDYTRARDTLLAGPGQGPGKSLHQEQSRAAREAPCASARACSRSSG